jgi:hypothetical protein
VKAVHRQERGGRPQSRPARVAFGGWHEDQVADGGDAGGHRGLLAGQRIFVGDGLLRDTLSCRSACR